MKRWVIFASLVTIAGCQYRDGLYCMKHPEDLGNCGRNDGGIDGVMGAHIGGTVNGLKGAGLVLQDNRTDDYTIFGDGTGNPVTFTFPTVLPYGSPYMVTVSQQPANPLQSCTVQKGSGNANTDVTDVDVVCATPSFAIGGSVVALTASGLSLHNASTGEDLAIGPGTTSFMFVTKEPSGSAYNVSIGAQPSGQTCSIFGGQGTVGTGDVTGIVVNCDSNRYVVYGNINGLQGTVTLKDTCSNSADNDTFTGNANGGFAFTKTISTGETYMVSVMTNPTYNASTGSLQQTCTPSNASGTAPSVNPVSISCTTNTYTIGGSVTGLTSGSVVLHEATGNDDVTVSSNTNFTFATRVASGSTYSVSVKTQPSQTLQCNVTSNATGTVTSSNINNVAVQCMYVDPGIACGTGVFCDPATSVCCDGTSLSCTAAVACTGIALVCDDAADCGTGMDCCWTLTGNGSSVTGTACKASGTCSGPHDYVMCDKNVSGSCTAPQTCSSLSTSPSGYTACQ